MNCKTSPSKTMPATVRKLRCAIYTRVSTDENLHQAYNSLHAQGDACGAYIKSQQAEGWILNPDRYDDGGFSGGTLERPALQRLLADIEAGRLDVIVVYKIDRLSRSLTDFVKLVEVFDANRVTFVSVTQSFNTTMRGPVNSPPEAGSIRHPRPVETATPGRRHRAVRRGKLPLTNNFIWKEEKSSIRIFLL